VARIGGDEFVVILPDVGAESSSVQVAEKIRESLFRPFYLAGKHLNISSSIGIAVYPAHGKNQAQLIKAADVAMYQAKERGRNCVVLYQPGLQDE
jgi:diguanylate cyclase (GGDEF)-like protein